MGINLVRLAGHQICDYCWALSRPLNGSEVESVSDYHFEPEWTLDTEFLVTFNESLLAGSLTIGGSTPAIWKVYRKEAGKDALVLAAVLNDGSKSFVDYNVRNNKEYSYQWYAVASSYITAPLSTDTIKTNWYQWCLFSVDEANAEGQHKLDEMFLFALDTKGGQMPNNVQSSTNLNFTRYPKIHKAQSNYYSGTLQSLLGEVACATGDYTELEDLEAALKEFSTNNKQKFLKDIKGHIWEIEITSFAVTPREGYGGLPYDITLGWVEIGSADNLLITN